MVTPRSIRIHRNKSCQGTLTCDQSYPEYLIWWQKTSAVLSYNRLRCVRKFTNIVSHLASLPSLISMSSLFTQDLPIKVHHLKREGRKGEAKLTFTSALWNCFGAWTSEIVHLLTAFLRRCSCIQLPQFRFLLFCNLSLFWLSIKNLRTRSNSHRATRGLQLIIFTT